MKSCLSIRLVTIQLITAVDERDRNPGECNHERAGCEAREEVEQNCQTSEKQSGDQEKPSFYRRQYSTIRESRTHSVADSNGSCGCTSAAAAPTGRYWHHVAGLARCPDVLAIIEDHFGSVA